MEEKEGPILEPASHPRPLPMMEKVDRYFRVYNIAALSEETLMKKLSSAFALIGLSLRGRKAR